MRWAESAEERRRRRARTAARGAEGAWSGDEPKRLSNLLGVPGGTRKSSTSRLLAERGDAPGRDWRAWLDTTKAFIDKKKSRTYGCDGREGCCGCSDYGGEADTRGGDGL